MKMFNMIEIGERAGSGVPDIFATWSAQGWKSPEIDEQYAPDRTILILSFSEKQAETGSQQRDLRIQNLLHLKKTKYQLQTSIQGILAFFDTKVYKPESFSDIESLSAIIPSGGGGTDFSCLFSYIESKGLMPASIVIFTDGKGKYPDEPSAANVPVLWLLNREGNTPPWGRSVRLRNP